MPFLQRVRRLEIDLTSLDSPSESALISLLVSRPETMLPNLRALISTVETRVERLRYVVPFLHDRLTKLIIEAEIGPSESFKSDAETFLEEAACRSTKLWQVTFISSSV